MTTSQPATNPITPTDGSSQPKSFNPSWMQMALKSTEKQPNGLYRSSMEEDPQSQEMMEPIFAKNRYGREDLLALMGKESATAPEGLSRCSFFLEKAETPIILLPLTEAELRLQQNHLNSSKALSSLSRQDRQSMLHGEPSVPTAGGWATAGSTSARNGPLAAKPQAAVPSRWSALGATSAGSSSSGRIAGTNPPLAGKRPGEVIKQPHPSFPPSSTARSRLKSTNDEDPAPQQPPAARMETASSIKGHGAGATGRHIWGGEPKDLLDPWQSLEAEISGSLTLDDSSSITGTAARQNSSQSFSSLTSQQTKESIQCAEVMHAESPKGGEPKLSFQQAPVSSDKSTERSALWQYLDPSGQQQGPFDSQRMHNWYKSGYFRKDLRLRRVGETAWISLGDLLNLGSGETDPFGIKPKNETLLAAQPGMWNEDTSAGVRASTFSAVDRAAEVLKEQLLKEKERQIEEEKRRLREKEELLMREMQERDEKERKMREMEAQLRRQQEEIERIALAKQRELENKKLEVDAYERQKREALYIMEEKIRAEQERRREEEMLRAQQEEQRRQAIAAEAKRREEEEEMRRVQQEQQRLLQLEAESKQKREEEERKIRAAYEEARRMQAKALEERKEKLSAYPPVESSRPTVGSQPAAAPRASAWNVVPAPQPVPIPKPNSKQPEAIPKKKQQKKNQGAGKGGNAARDPFVEWIIKRVGELNSEVDSEVFASFIEGIDSPNEVEDYVVSYFGDTRVARDFHREFLNKRIELRPRTHAMAKDDLSSALSASGPMAGNSSNANSNHNSASNSASAAQREKPRGKQKALDPKILGFRVVTDPRRLNVGEIDNEPPAPTRRKKR